MSKRPKLTETKQAFKKVYDDVGKSVSGVGKFIGGKVDYNINVVPKGQGRFENACAIRMSYVLNQTGFKIPYIKGQTVSGANGNWYNFKVKTLIEHLQKLFGKPDHVTVDPTAAKLAKYKGLVVFEVDQWTDATGHATIWDGAYCSDKCYFPQSKKAFIWLLKD